MPIFQYKGYRSDGSEAAGTLEASSIKDAVLKLKESGLYPKNVKEAIYRSSVSLFHRFDASLLPSVTRQLSTLLSSGVTLMDALSSISEDINGLSCFYDLYWVRCPLLFVYLCYTEDNKDI